MSKRGYISRYLLILKKLKVKPYSTYEELLHYIDNQLEYLQMQDDTLTVGFSKRTLQRDIKEIRNLFGIDVEFSKLRKGYFIIQNERENMNFQRMMEAFDMFNSLNLARDLTPFIHLEKRRPQGTENLYGILHAIKNKLEITFEYKKFWDDEPGIRAVAPYALKEFKNRWYILVKDGKDSAIKTFALDRLANLEITNKKFIFPANYNLERQFKFCFGIMGPNDEVPHEIILSFDPFQGKYVKTLPLHESQQILVANKDELQIKLMLYITYDFIMELLSFGENVKVLKPESLANEIKAVHQKAFERYQSI
jgi:predicted DNA-binding transcriptional regulator YafY